jgi:hypothetical protein
MQEKRLPVAPELVVQINRVVREAMGPFGLRSVEVRPGEDHDGDPVILVEAQYDLSERPLEPGITSELAGTVRELVRNAGETRFAHVWHKFHEKQKVAKPSRRVRA